VAAAATTVVVGIAVAVVDVACPLLVNPPHRANRCAPPSAFIIDLWVLTCLSISDIVPASVLASIPAVDSSSMLLLLYLLLFLLLFDINKIREIETYENDIWK